MSKKIFKFPLEATDRQTVLMPKGAQILCCQVQRVTPCLWAKLDETQPLVSRHISIYGTGHELPNETIVDDSGAAVEEKYIGTVQLDGGSLVLHVFDGGEAQVGYSADENMVRVDFFKESGKWYASEAMRWTGGYNNCDIHEAFMKSLKDHFGDKPRYQGMTVVCLEPYHEHSHPLLKTVPLIVK